MDKSKKILLISLVPAILTFVFIMYALIPVIGKASTINQELREEQAAFNETQAQINKMKEDKQLLKKVLELRERLSDFDVKAPQKDDLGVLLYDLEKFADSFNVKIITVNSKPEKIIELKNDSQTGKTKKSKRKSRKAKTTEEVPVQFSAIPLKIVVLGYYTDVLKFVDVLERYQRKIEISSISAINYKKDQANPKPRVEMTLDCSVYKMVPKEITDNLAAEDRS